MIQNRGRLGSNYKFIVSVFLLLYIHSAQASGCSLYQTSLRRRGAFREEAPKRPLGTGCFGRRSPGKSPFSLGGTGVVRRLAFPESLICGTGIEGNRARQASASALKRPGARKRSQS